MIHGVMNEGQRILAFMCGHSARFTHWKGEEGHSTNYDCLMPTLKLQNFLKKN